MFRFNWVFGGMVRVEMRGERGECLILLNGDEDVGALEGGTRKLTVIIVCTLCNWSSQDRRRKGENSDCELHGANVDSYLYPAESQIVL